jgi:adenylate cyclase
MTTEGINRKLAAILQTDVVGYSRLMSEDEDATLRTLTSYIDRISYLIKHNHGNVVKTTGDGVLAEFASAVDAVKCSVEIQQEIEHRNAELIESRRMEFRIGIHVGDIIEQNGDIFGDGVNIAARVEGLADPGSIYITRNVYDQVRRKLPYSYEFRGERKVKNIDEPIPVYRVLMDSETGERIVDKKDHRGKSIKKIAIVLFIIIAGLLIWRFYPNQRTKIESDSIETKQTPTTPEVKEAPKTIAVLPFVDISPEKDQEFFVDGLSEEILNSLTQIPGLGVTARTSSFFFKGTNKNVQEIANALGVDHILEGSVRKAGNALRITAQLVRAADGLHLWSKTYDRELKIEEIFAVQEDIASAVADELKITFGIDRSYQQLGSTDNLEAYELYLVAKGLLFQGPNSRTRALESIDAAIALDPRFALAWAWKSIVHSSLVTFGPADRVPLELDAAMEAALRAIEIEPSLGKAYLSLGSAYMNRCEFIEAELAYRKGMELTTESIDYFEYNLTAHYAVVGYLRKAIELYEEMRKNDPLRQDLRVLYTVNLALIGDMQRAEEEHKRGKAIFGDNWSLSDSYLTFIRFGAKDYFSINDISESLRADPISTILKEHIESPEEGLTELRRLYSGDDSLSRSNFVSIAFFAAYFGDTELAMNALERSVISRGGLIYIFWYPSLREIRKTPRFKEFVREIGLVDYWKEYGWPDICRPVGDDDFECD